MADVGAQVKIGAEASEYNRVVNQMPKTMQKAVGSITRMLDFGAVAMGMQSILSKMDDIADTATRLGASAEDVQRIGGAAKMVGSNLDAVDRAIRTIAISAKQAADKGGEAADKFSQIGIDPAKFAASSLAERVQMLADAQAAAAGNAEKMAAYWDAVGARAGGIDFNAIAQLMGQIAVASDETVRGLAEANDYLDKMKAGATIFGATLLSYVVKANERLGSMMAQLLRAWQLGDVKELGGFASRGAGAVIAASTGNFPAAYQIMTAGAQTIEEMDALNTFKPPSVARSGASATDAVSGGKAKSISWKTQSLMDGLEKSLKDATKAADNAAKAKIDQLRGELEDLDLKYRSAVVANDAALTESLQREIDLKTGLIKYNLDEAKALRAQGVSIAERSKRNSDELAQAADKARRDAEAQRAEEARAAEEAAKQSREKFLKYWHLGSTVDRVGMDILKAAASSGRFGGVAGFTGMLSSSADWVARGTNADLMSSTARIQKMQERASEYYQRGAYGSAAALTDRMNAASERQVGRMVNRLRDRINRNQEQIDSGRYSPEEAALRTNKNNDLRKALDAMQNATPDKIEQTVGDILSEIQKRLPITALG